MVDTGMGIVSLRAFAKDMLDKPVTAVATHVHADHIGNHHEFDDCLVHELEAEGLRTAGRDFTLAGDEFDARDLATLLLPKFEAYTVEGPLLTALPHAGYNLASFRIPPMRTPRTVTDGDRIDLGDRSFEVLHLPGHSPGGIGLWETRTGTLFSGDAIYDSELLDSLHHSSIPDYVSSFERLRELPVRVVHAGHDPSFGRQRLMEITAGLSDKVAGIAPATLFRSGQVEPVRVHDLGPGRHEIVDELLLGILAGIDLGHRAQHRV